jgi:hypothetical protein
VAGNAAAAGLASANYAIDTRAPTVSSVVISDSALKIGDTATVTIVMSEAVSGSQRMPILKMQAT